MKQYVIGIEGDATSYINVELEDRHYTMIASIARSLEEAAEPYCAKLVIRPHEPEKADRNVVKLAGRLERTLKDASGLMSPEDMQAAFDAAMSRMTGGE